MRIHTAYNDVDNNKVDLFQATACFCFKIAMCHTQGVDGRALNWTP